MRRYIDRKPAEFGDYDLRNMIICPEGVQVVVDDRPGRLALIHPGPSQEIQAGDLIRDQGNLYRLDEFVCSMGFHRDEILVYRIVQVG